MSDVHIDGDLLRAAASRVDAVVQSFATAGSDAREAADYVGHDGLAHRVRDFAGGWDIHRARLTDEFGQLAAMLEAVAQTFADLDDRLAATARQAVADPVPRLTEGRDT